MYRLRKKTQSHATIHVPNDAFEQNPVYFDWLVAKLMEDDQPDSHHYHSILKILHSIDFDWVLSEDADRNGDGCYMRNFFEHEMNAEGSGLDVPYRIKGPSTMLEFLVALADRMAYITNYPISIIRKVSSKRTNYPVGNSPDLCFFFWMFLENMGVLRDDGNSNLRQRVESCSFNVIKRTFGRLGEGSIITLKECSADLRDSPFWHHVVFYFAEVDRLISQSVDRLKSQSKYRLL